MKQLLCIVFVLFNSLLLFSQTTTSIAPKPKRFDLSAMVGWNFVSGNSSYKVVNAPIYSAAVNYILNDRTHIELNYNYMTSDMMYKSYGAVPEIRSPYYQGFIQAGIMRIFAISNPNLMPYTLATIGGMYSGVKGGETHGGFAAGINFGVKYLMNEKAGIRIQARLQAPLSGAGLGVGVGTGGVNVGVGSYSNAVQLDLSGGVFFRL
ncbi:MAG: hypothetical protein H7259_10700 [Cytophagales bacterium]|nr:hypothetical protein [Cytophaga sp.]